MSEISFHFAQPLWFFALFAIVPMAVWLSFSVQKAHHGPIHRYADAHLLPHLSGTRELESGERWGRFARWSLLWLLAVAALAGPRWSYTDVRLFHPGNNLLILLDISRSMQTPDVPPSRLGRAKQEIQDLINMNRAVRIGLLAFSSVPHVITPITEDTATIHNALPAIDTELTRLQGSRLLAALDRAEILMDGLSADSAKTLLLISDGDFDEPGLLDRVKQLAQKNIRLLTLGVGTAKGAEVPATSGGVLTDARRQVISSRLDEAQLKQLAEAGNGFYLEAGFRDSDSEEILAASALLKPSADDSGDSTRIWDERFFWLVWLLMLLLLPTFRRQIIRKETS